MDYAGFSKGIGGEAVTQQDQYMLMFSLGPVQTFIAQARKTRDLWLGSLLLSKLMEAAMERVEGEFIFPATQHVENTPDLPNKYVAIFDSLEKAQEAVELSKKGIRRLWDTIRGDVWQTIVKDYADTETIAIWQRQSDPDAFFEFFWVIVSGDPSDYPVWLSRTQDVFDARKRLRNFGPRDEPGEKSTITGEREALHGSLHAKDSIRKQVKQFWQILAKRAGNPAGTLSAKDISLDGEERLDAIDTIKRFATVSSEIPQGAFPSTSSVAAASFVEELIKHYHDLTTLDRWLKATDRSLAEMRPDAIPYLYKLAKAIPGATEILKRDGDLYFPETFTSYRMIQDYEFTDEAKAKSVAETGRRALSALITNTNAHNITRPTPYYALIQMDGDKMGILLSKVESVKEHIDISTALSDFSRNVVRLLVEENYPGRLIYAGGDDVFALAPLARNVSSEQGIVTALDLANKLQEAYHSTVADSVLDLKRKENVTASTGIAIAHHYTSLSYMRRVAKASEDLAKEHYGRNTLVVTVIRRSGEQTRVGCHWRYAGLADEGQPISLVTRFYELFKFDMLSPKSVYILLEEASTLVKLEQKAQQSEIKRVFLRQSSDGKQKKLDEKEIGRLSEHLINLAVAMDNDNKRKQDNTRSVELHSDKRRYGLVEVLGWLLVAAFLARKDQE